MGLFGWLRGQAPEPPSATATSLPTPSPWRMPQYQGRDICDWIDVIAALKRQDRLDEALDLATGCMNAMIETARANPGNAMEFYVIQVAVIEHKMRAYRREVRTIESWLALEIPAPREDHRLDLRKRMAKAQELVAKEQGQDPSPFHAEWKRLLDLEKEQKAQGQPSATSSTVSSGRSALRPGTSYSSNRKARSIPDPGDLLAPTFVAVDFETANRAGGVSACQIALAKVHRGKIVDRYATMLKPPAGFDTFEFTYLHGIGPRDVRNAPMWPQVAEYIRQFVGDVPVWAHNSAFDSKVWTELDGYFGTHTRPQRFYCSYRTAQRLIPGLENYKLPTVLAACAPEYQLNHHRADSDTEACALIVADLQRRA
ncbi:exonuclease domain-containing protein [Schaalia vaccimaxillae]|uniref:exonuclease domain-containing protein n=1 Tax=Schaalia vaccimaxillae TaxID=183916 RepID=UPI0003B6F357|nr:exonuclease domain-containing protein [Schaalia vaccimaxillae]